MSKFKFLIVTAIVGVALTASSAFAACGDYGPVTLRKGSNGVYVQTLQTQLALTADGAFGPKTEAAVKAFQLGKGLSADGVVGVQTKAALAAACGTTTTPVVTTPVTTTPTLSGDAGDLDIGTPTSRGVEDDVKEDSEENVLGYKVEAEDSDITISTVKVELVNSGVAGTSEDLEDYIDEVKVYLGDKEVGSADADEFSRDRGTWDIFTESIKLSNAVVKEGDSEYLYVAVVTKSIDTEDEDATWNIEVIDIRFMDGTGAIMSEADLGDDSFGFDTDSDDSIEIKSSSGANPDESTIKVEEDDESDEALAFAFKLEVDDDSSDISVFELPIEITVDNNSQSVGSVDEIISSVVVKIDGEEFDADIDVDFSGATGTATYMVEFDDEEMVIKSGDTVEVKVYLTFAEQEDAYDSGTTVKLSVTGGDMDAESEDGDTVDVDGSKTSNVHTLSSSPATIDGYSWTVASTGTYVDFFFTVEAEDEDFEFDLADVVSEDRGTATIGATPTLSKYSGTATVVAGTWTVEEGDTAKFRVRYDVYGTEGQWAEVIMTSVCGENVPEDKEISPSATLDMDNAPAV